MKRKLIKQAGQAITITLPIDWIRENALKPGDEIDLDTNGRDLILKSGKKTLGESIKLDLSDMDIRLNMIYVQAAYAKGVDKISIKTNEDVYYMANTFIGYAVMSQKKDYCVIKDVSGMSSEDLNEIFKRVFQMLIAFYDSAIESIFKDEKIEKSTLDNKDAEINKFTYFLQRSIMKHTYDNLNKGQIMFAYSFALEKIGDIIHRLWRTHIYKKIKLTNQVKEVYKASQKALQLSFEIYYRTSKEKVKELYDLKHKARSKKLLQLDRESLLFVNYALRIIEDVADLTHLSLMNKL